MILQIDSAAEKRSTILQQPKETHTHAYIHTSSGEMMSLKLRRSSSSGKLISHVFGRFNSLMSETQTGTDRNPSHTTSEVTVIGNIIIDRKKVVPP